MVKPNILLYYCAIVEHIGVKRTTFFAYFALIYAGGDCGECGDSYDIQSTAIQSSRVSLGLILGV